MAWLGLSKGCVIVLAGGDRRGRTRAGGHGRADTGGQTRAGRHEVCPYGTARAAWCRPTDGGFRRRSPVGADLVSALDLVSAPVADRVCPGRRRRRPVFDTALNCPAPAAVVAGE